MFSLSDSIIVDDTMHVLYRIQMFSVSWCSYDMCGWSCSRCESCSLV